MAKRELLRQPDFPKGWKELAGSSTGSGTLSSSLEFDQVARCEGVSVSHLGRSAWAGIGFDRLSDFEVVLESVGLFSSTINATTYYDLFASRKALSCLRPVVAGGSISGKIAKVTPSSITIAKVTFPKEGSATTALRLGFAAKVDSQIVHTQVDMILIRSATSLSLLIIPLAGVPVALVYSVAKNAAARLR
ncbi:MAG: hypothetical protein ACRDXC_12440 [Acidimicrobiales bacterium]